MPSSCFLRRNFIYCLLIHVISYVPGHATVTQSLPHMPPLPLGTYSSLHHIDLAPRTATGTNKCDTRSHTELLMHAPDGEGIEVDVIPWPLQQESRCIVSHVAWELRAKGKAGSCPQ